MRQFIILLFLIVSVNIANAQFADNNAIYLSGELGGGNYFNGDLSLNYVYKGNYSLKMGYSGNVRKAVSRPEDYQSGLVKGLFLFGLINPKDYLDSYHISLGKIMNLNKNKKIRLNLMFGVGYTTITEPENWEKVEGTIIDGLVMDNYTWDDKERHGVSFIVNPKIEFPVTRYWGVTVSPMVQFNKDRTYFGISVGSMLGFLKGKNK